MAHEITEHDQVLLHQTPAWHGLGMIVQDAPTARDAQKLVLPWEVEQWPMYAANGPERLVAEDFQANVRKDTKAILGVVGSGWKPVQPSELADLCDALASEGDVVKVESAGSIRGGEKIWFLLKGESFSVRKDEVVPYYCISTGFDGGTSTRGDPTTVKVVCSNTLHMVIPQSAKEGSRIRLGRAGFSFSHVGDVRGKVEECRMALGLYQKAIAETRKVIDRLAAQDVTSAEVQQFFLESYTRDFGAIPINPLDKKEARQRDKALDACADVFARFDRERNVNGPTLWNAFNSYTGWLQNDRGHRKSQEWSRLVGTEADRSVNAFEAALAMAV